MTESLISKGELDAIRSLSDSNLVDLVSEINDGGWMLARRTLARMKRIAANRGATRDVVMEVTGERSEVAGHGHGADNRDAVGEVPG